MVKGKNRREEEEDSKPKERALLTKQEVINHLVLRKSILYQLRKFNRPAEKEAELSRQLRNIQSELDEHWDTFPKRPVEDYSGLPRPKNKGGKKPNKWKK